MRVFLIGYMGSGKSTVGARLARALSMEFIDLDQYIVQQSKRSIQVIFNAEGEAGFRGIERRCLREVCDSLDQVVVATGGGTPCFYDNMAYMKDHGLTVYLEMDAVSLTYRLENSDDGRPLITGMDAKTLLAFVEQQLQERKEFYEESEIVVKSLGFDQKKIESLADAIVNHSK